MTEKKPTLCMVAGPNGSGKTTDTIMILIKHVRIYILLALCASCMSVSDEKQYTISETNGEYCVTLNGRVINQLFVLSKYKNNKADELDLRVVLNHGYAPNHTNQYARVNYHEYIQALSRVVKTISLSSDINNLGSIEIDLIALGDECLRITKDYKKDAKENAIDNHDVSSVLWRSRLVTDIQRILSNYHLIISDIIVEMPFYTDWDDFSSYNDVSRTSAKLVTDKILRGIVYLNCSSTNVGTLGSSRQATKVVDFTYGR